MKLHVMSDLHLEHQRHGPYGRETAFWAELERRAALDTPAAVVLAGDIDEMARRGLTPTIVTTLERFAKIYPRVLYVPGNHDHFDIGVIDGYAELKDLPANVHVLRPGTKVDVNGLVFTGGTLWYPDCGDYFLKKHWIDYDLIHDADPEVHAQHDLFVEKVLADPGDVVVSHMFPTAESVHAKYRGANTNVFFCADIADDIIEQKAKGVAPPKLWIHGHTHSPFDYKSKLGFRVYCNPHGYPFENGNAKFWDRILIETDDQKWYLKTLNGGSNDD